MRFLKSEAGAVICWLIGILLLSAVLLPWVYGAGKELAASAEARDLNPFLEWVGASAGRAEPDRFFSRCMAFSAIVLLPFFVLRLRSIPRGKSTAPVLRTPPLPAKTKALQWFAGFLIAAGLLWLAGTALEYAGAFEPRSGIPGFSKWLKKAILPALGASVVEEWLFRGLLLGVWLRIARPSLAILGTTLTFAFVHFMEPPAGSELTDPSAPLAGFELLAKIFLNFTDIRFMAAEFATLFAVGLILAIARLRTGSLWLPIGLHAGWILAFKGFNLLHRDQPDNPLGPLWIGDSLRSGLVPLGTLLVTGWLCHLLIRFTMPTVDERPR